MVQEIDASDARAAIAREVLEALPDWFGIPESREASIRDSRAQPFWADLENGAVRRVLALRETSPYTAELAAMGVLPAYHRQGIGRALFAAFHQYARENGYAFLQVKTVQEGRYASYNQTNVFYRSLGFRELACLPMPWGRQNPC